MRAASWFTRACLSFALGVGAIGAVTYAGGYRLNLSASAPQGLWQTLPEAVPIRGALVAACPPPGPLVRAMHAAGHIPPGDCPSGTAPLIKTVVAVAGDQVTIAPAQAMRVNGIEIRNSAALQRADLPAQPPGTHQVNPGQVWIVSVYAAGSFDSRYFGPIAATEIRAVVRPIFVTEEH